jgi:hypothetical protein
MDADFKRPLMPLKPKNLIPNNYFRFLAEILSQIIGQNLSGHVSAQKYT